MELSARAFDDGFEGEAKRLAAAIRLLVHDTQRSNSLLGQLGRKGIAFYDTCIPQHPHSILTHDGINAMHMTTQMAKYVAPLDQHVPDSPPRRATFERWWNGVIFVDTDKQKTTRRDLILAVANKDGGTHVDPVLDGKYADLSRRNSLGWKFSGPKGELPMEGPELAALRQISHEVLRSLNPTMPRTEPKITEGILTRGGVAIVGPKVTDLPKGGRNEPCYCGSGEKFKRCHGRLW